MLIASRYEAGTAPRRLLPSVAALFALTGCAAPINAPSAAGCPIAGSTGWAAWVNALPSPQARATLIVTGKVTVPTGGYRPQLVLEQIAESYPVQVFSRLQPNPPLGPATQAFATHTVRAEWPMNSPVGSVTVRCGAQVVAHVSPVRTAH